MSVLKDEGGEELRRDGVIPFADTPVGEWYTLPARHASDLGLVSGTGESDGRKVEPGRETNVAEAIMMFARLSDEDTVPSGTPESSIGQNLPDWAQSGASVLEDEVNLDAIFGASAAADGVSRGQVARLLMELLDLPVASEGSEGVFNDLQNVSPDMRSAILAVQREGIMTGKDELFRPFDTLNRAELMTVLIRVMELDL